VAFDLLVVAGEASGDRAAAAVLSQLEGVRAFGMGGAALANRGMQLVADLEDTTALGLGEVAARACSIAGAHARLVRAIERWPVRAALLVNYTEYNARLAPRLHARGVRVLWYGAPQIWAWRPGRGLRLRRYVDRMAVVLPFEEALWRSLGVDARYVGHPAREGRFRTRDDARLALGLTQWAPAVAILPGSRPHEVRALLGPMLEGYERVRRDRASLDARVLLAPSLDEHTRAYAASLAAEARVGVYNVNALSGAGVVLRAFDVALCASGTAALEAALARAVPIVAYRVGLATELAARGLLRTPYVALPNVLLGRAAFAELLQRDARPKRFAFELARGLDKRGTLLSACNEVETALGTEATPSRVVARMLSPWLESPRFLVRVEPGSAQSP
jgi:lipid-A-disaccharide synthase